MPWSNNPPFSIEEARKKGQDVYEVIVTEWGFPGIPGNPPLLPENMQWPTGKSLSTSLAGIAIGPQSTVDRAWVSYNLQKKQTVASPFNLLTDRLRRLSVDTPLLFTQASAPGTSNQPGVNGDPRRTMAQYGSLYVYPYAFGSQPQPITNEFPDLQETTVLPDSYLDVGGVSREFDNPIYPKLHLYLYLRPPIIYAPIKRFPLQTQASAMAITGAFTEQLVAQIPTFGRKSIHLMMMSDQIASFRVGALRGISQLAGMQEQPVDSASTVPANTPTILSSCIQNNHDADYTNLYVTSVVDATIKFQFTAYD